MRTRHFIVQLRWGYIYMYIFREFSNFTCVIYSVGGAMSYLSFYILEEMCIFQHLKTYFLLLVCTSCSAFYLSFIVVLLSTVNHLPLSFPLWPTSIYVPPIRPSGNPLPLLQGFFLVRLEQSGCCVFVFLRRVLPLLRMFIDQSLGYNGLAISFLCR